MTFETEIKIHFDEADPAGIAFSGGLFTKMHRCYEDFIVALEIDPQEFFLNPTVIVPLRHVEADYLRPLRPLQKYQVVVSVTKMSESSFQLQFEVKQKNQNHAVLRSTHVCCSKETLVKCPIPDHLRQSLEKFAAPQSLS